MIVPVSLVVDEAWFRPSWLQVQKYVVVVVIKVVDGEQGVGVN